MNISSYLQKHVKYIWKLLFMVKFLEKMEDKARYNFIGYLGYRGGPGFVEHNII